VNENPYVLPMARPRLPEGPKVGAALRLSEPIRTRLDQIAAAKGITRSNLLEQIVTRWIERYPLDDDD
jgi:predicted transcriptional regulator